MDKELCEAMEKLKYEIAQSLGIFRFLNWMNNHLSAIKEFLTITFIVIPSFLMLYNILWFWYQNPKLTQMQVFLEKWPWVVWPVVTYFVALKFFHSDG